MNVKIYIGTGVSPRLQKSAQRQIDYKLGSMQGSVNWIKVTLARAASSQSSQEGESPVFVCKMLAKLSNGTSHEVTTRGFQPNTCIADTASRLGRAIAREGKWSAGLHPVRLRTG